MTKSIDLSVIIPAYNEAQRLGPHLASIQRYLNDNFPEYELIFVDDGSTDQTAQVISKGIAGNSRAKLITYTPNRGKGYATRTGVLASQGKDVLFMDADMSTPVEEIPTILKSLKGADIVIGSRAIVSSKLLKKAPFFRRFSSWVFDQIKYTIVGLRSFKDTQCGFKIFKGPVARQLFALSKVDRFMFDVEILYLAERAGLEIVELPITWSDMPGSHVGFLEGIINMFRDLWRIRRMHPRKIVLRRA